MKLFFIILFSFFVLSCQKKTEGFNSKPKNVLTPIKVHEGKKLMSTNCYLCHSPSAPESEGRIGPPMIAIKVFYLDKYPVKADFIKAIKDFTENPSHDKVILDDDIKKYGLMPKQSYPDNMIEKIADFMFEYQIEYPTWFETYYRNKKPNWQQSGAIYEEAEAPKTYAEIGLNYALETKKILGKNLMGSIQKNGTLEALKFCNHRALPLTDSLSKHYNATIKRVSDKNRQPKNKATGESLKMIAYFKNLITQKKAYKPIAVESKNHVDVYYPIETNSMCLQCHGKNINPEVHKQILKLYPNDQAIGYEENELRGVWQITFKTKE